MRSRIPADSPTPKLGRLIRLALLASLLALALPATASATIFEVDEDDPTADTAIPGADCGTSGESNRCDTIQKGIDEADAIDVDSADLIIVHAPENTDATYTQSIVPATEPNLTIRGPNPSTAGRLRASVPDVNFEAVVVPTGAFAGFTVNAADTTITGFAIDGAGGTGPGIALGTGIDAVITNNIIRDNGNGLELAGTGHNISQNAFYSNNAAAEDAGINATTAISGTIDDNLFSGHTLAGIRLIGPSSDVDITDNDHASGGAVGGDAGFYLLNLTNSLIQGNDIKGAFGDGIRFSGTDTNILSNVIALNGNTAGESGLRFHGPADLPAAAFRSDNVVVRGNEIVSNFADGVRLVENAFVDDEDVLMEFNRFFNNGGEGIRNEDGGAVNEQIFVDGENNWFGCNDGPDDAACDGTEGFADVFPWLVLTVSANPTSVAVPGRSTITADFLHDFDGDMPSGASAFPSTLVTFLKDSGPGTVTQDVTTPPFDVNPTQGGVATNTISSSTTGTAVVEGTVDSETVSASVVFTTPPPDADGDGVPDSTDQCDTTDGPASNNGCPPDTDGDGVVDATDLCDTTDGPASNGGCPTDTDGDGVLNVDDECPDQPGKSANNGCPRVKLDKLVEKVSPGTDESAPYKFKVRGALDLPDGVSKSSSGGAHIALASSCKGKVAITIRRAGGGKIKGKTVKVKSNCKYTAKFVLSENKLPGSGALKFKAKFKGNKALKARKSATKIARFG